MGRSEEHAGDIARKYVVLFGTGAADVRPYVVRARSLHGAWQQAISDQPALRAQAAWVGVQRARFRARERVFFNGNTWPGDGPGGTAGVREPRRPRPTPPSVRH